MKRLKILHIVSDSAPGGVPSLVYLLLKHRDKTRFEMAVACRTNGPFYQEALSLGVKVYPIQMEKKLDWRGVLALWQICREWRPDVVHTHANRAGLAGRIAAFLANRPIIIHSTHGLHLTEHHLPRRIFFLKRIEQLLGLLTTRLLACSKSEAELFTRLKLVPARKQAVIENGIELEKFYQADTAKKRELKVALGFPPACFLISTIGRLTEQKAPQIFIEVAAKIAEACPDARFLIVGDGPMRVELESLSKIKKLDERLNFMGAVEREKIPDILAAFDLFILTSLWEGFPFVVIEAMAAGVPVVSTATIGPIDQIIHGETGLLAPVNDIEKLAEHALNLLQNPALARHLAQNACEYTCNHYSIQNIVPRFENLYLSLSKNYE